MRDIELLEPEFRNKVKLFLKKLDEKKIEYYILETLRTLDVQRAYYAQGRYDLDRVNELRKKAGLYLLGENENRKKITWTMKSKHLDGRAIDIAPLKNNKPWWSAPDEKWKEMADIALEIDGLKPGYYWREKDSPHYEI